MTACAHFSGSVRLPCISQPFTTLRGRGPLHVGDLLPSVATTRERRPSSPAPGSVAGAPKRGENLGNATLADRLHGRATCAPPRPSQHKHIARRPAARVDRIVPEDSVAPAKRGGVQRTQTWNEGTRHRTTSHDRTNRAPQAWAGPAQAHAHESQRATRIISRAPTRACLGAG